MKKWIVLFSMAVVLVGCSATEEKKSNNADIRKEFSSSVEAPAIKTEVDQSSGLSDYIEGKAISEIKEVVSIREDGFKDEVTIEGEEFNLAIPSSLTDKKLRLKVALENGKKFNTVINLPKRASIDSYKNFASQMNRNMNDINDKVKTNFPLTVKKETLIAADENNAQTWIHVLDGELVGLSMIGSEDAGDELATIISSFIMIYEVDNDKVFSAQNDFSKTGEKTSVTSNGYMFTFDHNDEYLYIDIIKTTKNMEI